MLRVRFSTIAGDWRPINWPIKHPYWKTGEDAEGETAILVAYADDLDYIYRYWPEAEDVVGEEVDGYVFTDRFPKPEWFTEE